MEKSKDYYKKYGPIFKIRIGPVYPTIMVCDSKFIGMILSSPKMTKKGIDYVLLKDWLGDGLLTSDRMYLCNSIFNISYMPETLNN